MNRLLALARMLLLFPVLALCIVRADAQALETIKSQEELNNVIASLDAALFDSYNRCDLEKFATFFTDDMEFYHDQLVFHPLGARARKPLSQMSRMPTGISRE